MTIDNDPFANAIVLTVAGGLAVQDRLGRYDEAAFFRPTHAVEDADGNILVSDTCNHKIKKISRDHQVVLVAGSSEGCDDGSIEEARFGAPTYLAVAADGSVYVSDRRFNVIRRIVPGKGVETAAGTTNRASFVETEDKVLVVDHRGRTEYRLEEWDISTNDWFFAYFDGPKEVARFSGPAGLALTSEGELLVADAGNSVIRIVERSGEVRTLAGARLKQEVFNPITRDGQGHEARFRDPVGICPGERNTFLVTNHPVPSIREVDLDGRVTSIDPGNVEGADNRYDNPGGIVRTANGDLFVTMPDQDKIGCRSKTGQWYFLGGPEAGHVDGQAHHARFSGPTGLSLDRDGNLLVTDSENSCVRRVILAPTADLMAKLPSTDGAKRAVLYEAEPSTFRELDQRPFLPAVQSWSQLLYRQITFTETGYIEESYTSTLTLQLGDVAATIAAITDDPCMGAYPVFADDHRGKVHRHDASLVVGQTICSLRLHLAAPDATGVPVKWMKLQFTGGGYQYLFSDLGDGLRLLADSVDHSLLPVSAAISRSIEAAEFTAPHELTIRLSRGRLIISSTDGSTLETLSCNDSRWSDYGWCRPEGHSAALDAFDDVPNQYLKQLGIEEPQPSEPIFSIRVPAFGADAEEDDGDEVDNEDVAPDWKLCDPTVLVEQELTELDVPLAPPHEPIGKYALLTFRDWFLFQVRTSGAGLTCQYVD